MLQGLKKDVRPVMGIDPSLTSTGICVIYPENGEMKFKTFLCGYVLKKAKNEKKQKTNDVQKMNRLCEIQDKVKNIASNFDVKAIGIEGMAFKGHGLASLGEVFGIIRMGCFRETGLVVSAIPPKSARKYLIDDVPSGSVKAKAAVKKFFEEKFGLKVEGTDESDAACVAMVVWDWMNRERATLPTRKLEVLMRLDIAQGV